MRVVVERIVMHERDMARAIIVESSSASVVWWGVARSCGPGARSACAAWASPRVAPPPAQARGRGADGRAVEEAEANRATCWPLTVTGSEVSR